MQYIQFQSQLSTDIPSPSEGLFNFYIDSETNLVSLKGESGVTINLNNNVTDVTYSELVGKITGNTLTIGQFYLITNFKTCYDQPDFDYNGNPITTGVTKQAAVEPIIVFATSDNTISSTAYQPTYPNDRIQYDWTWNMTEVTSGTSYGRITERIDEFNNRTDYDHRTILFKRYRLYTYREGLRLNGTIQLSNNGIVSGTNTSFTALTVGDVVYIPNADPSYYEIIGITGNTSMRVSGDTIGTTGSGSAFYLGVEETNDNDRYFSYKRTNVKTNDFIEYTTFGDAISNEYAKNNYVGNYANNYDNIGSGTFILSNNVFLEGQYDSNKFGDYCYNNTFGTDNENNIWGDWCYENVSTNDIDDCIIGHYFNNNLINTNLTSNHIGNNFNNNQLLAENNEDFEDNIIGNGFNNNIIYSRFYKNEILDNFNDNVIGDFGNLDDNEFYRNYIRNNFNQNIIRDDFQNNQIGSNFNNNTINGEFIGNTILNGFNNNQTGHYFALNNIGNGYNNNDVYDNFRNNSTDYYFYDNIISNNFYENNVGIDFRDNRPYNYTLFGWNNLSTVSTRNYELFYDAVNTNFNDKILGKEFVMKIISTSQYFKIKFTQWTRSNGGGGFQYERQEIDFSGSPIGNSIIFNKTNGGSEVDIIVEGVVEITRGNSNGIYNIATEGSWNSSVSPQDTEWNSIYTQTNNGNNFRNNVIGNNFEDNIIGNNFEDNQIGFDFQNNEITNDFNKNEIASGFNNNSISGETSTNRIGEQFENNTIYGDFYDNQIFNEFKGNITYQDFFKNRLDWGFGGNQFSGFCSDNTFGPTIDSNDFLGDVYANTFKGGVFGNTIGDNFSSNNIGFGFSSNVIGENFGNGGGQEQGNTIGNNFIDNTIGEYFYNNTIADNFRDNEIGNYFQWNVINTNIDNTYFTLNYGNITGFSYTAAGTAATDGTYNGLTICGTTLSMGVGATFDVQVSGGTIVGVTGATQGRLYQISDVLPILGTQIGGVTGEIDGFSSDAVGKSGTTGSYTGITATGIGGGENATFDIVVVGNLVTGITLNNVGGSYSIGDILTIVGSEFGGVDGTDDITITVDSLYSDDIVITVTGTSEDSLFYQHHTKQIFERRLGNKRVSFYDEDDILNVDSVYEISGYIPVYSQSLTFPYTYTSFEFLCDGSYTNPGGTTSQTVNNMKELVTLFNDNFRNIGYFFDNNDGTLGVYINPSLKEQYCPNGTYSIEVFND